MQNNLRSLDPTYLVNLIFNLYHKYGSDSTSIYVDGSNRAFLNMLKIAFNESLNWEKSITKPNPNNMNVIPVNFSTDHKANAKSFSNAM